ncbi:dipeptide ABC transporter ATP-binding protein [Candidatus Hydrogenosomobacter endosymbioticus]|uniref:ABC transporter ATP-binding protein n=1 Tax=Candidatus Hydrogenosomobacter endosymbioticus TaxID=2558174 RepID=A0ABN6L3G4_9PROT|nr:dipeptide ABC transporter ATP-binding protein [Candidatus Hydrogenosomobacter endosymbioticus]BDB96471.1 ABC transporter ATP-binding protein [Candidatus Hydrogenosomobacter endosymbioticus]
MTSRNSQLIEVSDLKVSFFSDMETVEAVRGVSFSVGKGDALAIVGESGSGKTISCLSLARLLPKSALYSGKVTIDGIDIFNASEQELCALRGSKIAYIFQEPLESLNPTKSLFQQLASPILAHSSRRIKHKELKEICVDMLDLTGLYGLRDRLNAFPHQISGGQRQRLMIAMALSCSPSLLIADEPTTALDVSIQAEILDTIASIREKRSMSLIVVTHNIGIVPRVADTVCVMRNGTIIERGKAKEISVHPQNPYTIKLVKSGNFEDISLFSDDSPKKNSRKIILDVRLLKVSAPDRESLFISGKERLIVNSVSFKISEGETLGVIGESGSGKTTIAMAVLRLIKSSGAIIFDGTDISNFSHKTMRKFRRNMQIVFQDPFSSLNPRRPVKKIISEGLFIHKIADSDREIDRLVDEALFDVGLDARFKNSYPHELSGGQRQRIAIARVLVLKPKLIVLDEPTSALDMTIQHEIIKLLLRLQKEYTLSYMFISHDLNVIRAVSHEIAVLRFGEIIEVKKNNDLFKLPENEYTVQLIRNSLL